MQIIKIDVKSKDVLCSYKDIDIGVVTKKYIAESKVSDAEKMRFQMECLQYLATTIAKIIERSPLKYRMVHAITCLSSYVVAHNHALCEKKMK